MSTFDTPEIPETEGNYMNFKPGENRFRILDSPIAGNLYWKNKKPVRKHLEAQIDPDELEFTGKGDPIKYFWDLPVFHEGKVKVLEITQKGILKEIKNLSQDEDWGDPRNYDIVVQKTGEGMETKYSVMPKPAKPLSDEGKKAWEDAKKNGFNLNVLYEGGNPFNGKNELDKILDEPNEPIDNSDEEVDISDIEF